MKKTEMVDAIKVVNTLTDIIFLSLMLFQQISGRSQEEILEDIKTAGKKTDALLEQLRSTLKEPE